MKLSQLFTIVVAATTLATGAESLAAPIYNVNMMAFRGSSGGAAAFTPIDGTAATGPADFTGNRWNDVQVTNPATVPLTATNLIDSEGNPSTVGFEIAEGVSSWSDPSFVLDAMEAYAFSTSNDPVNMKLSGLAPGTVWELYIMSHGDGAAQFGTFDLGGDVRATANQDVRPETAWGENINYVRFSSVVADASGEINWTMSKLNGSSHMALNGLQLVAVPEPTALGLLAGAAIGIVISRRRD